MGDHLDEVFQKIGTRLETLLVKAIECGVNWNPKSSVFGVEVVDADVS